MTLRSASLALSFYRSDFDTEPGQFVIQDVNMLKS